MATNNYIQIQVISRDMGFTYTPSPYPVHNVKVDDMGSLTSISVDVPNTTNYQNLPNASTETWYGFKFGSWNSYSQTGYAPFGFTNLQLTPNTSGLRFVIDLIHTETNGNAGTYDTTPLLRTIVNYGKFIYSPFNSILNGWVQVDQDNVLKVYVDAVNTTYFDQLNYATRSQLLIQVIGHWEQATTTYNITNTSTNCTGSNTDISIEDGESYTNTFTPNSGYAFNSGDNIYATCNGNRYDGVLNSNGSITITIPSVDGDIVISGSAIAKYSLTLDLYNCVLYNKTTLYFRSGNYQTANKLLETDSNNPLYGSGATIGFPIGTKRYVIGSIYTNTGTMIPTPDGTYLTVINNVLYLHWSGNNTNACYMMVDIEYTFDYVLNGESYSFTLHSNESFLFKSFPRWEMGASTGSFALFPSDKSYAEIRQNLLPYITIDNNLTIQANATLSGSLKYGFVSIYNPTYDEVEALSKKRFYNVSQGVYEDMSQYIISFRKLYVDIPEIARELVYFGRYNTSISSNIITTNFIETDCGSLSINELYENSLDYSGVEIEVYLPFIGTVTLNPNQVYGKTLHLIYRTNPINGDCVAMVYSDDVQIAYSQGNVSFDVPINFKYGNLNNYGTNDNALYMCGLQPYIEVKTSRQYQSMNQRLLNNNIWVQISSCSGYVQFDEVDMNPINRINKDEYDEIISLLQGGIIV